ncbi:BTB/POZ domain-containing protein, partial [Campylobacter jejuni]|uniref:BTB/POZ domain-containing protein n=1 Tax=Campylobacter jejuni TaxID=197 RepID=UPI001E584960
IVFQHQGRTKPDVRLCVFDAEFHVHSEVLKFHSQFFRAFLDSPDKVGTPASFDVFKYTWVTKMDDDGKGWSLVAAGSEGTEVSSS